VLLTGQLYELVLLCYNRKYIPTVELSETSIISKLYNMPGTLHCRFYRPRLYETIALLF